MQLIPDWRKVLRYAFSIRYMVLAVIFSGLEVTLPLLEGYLPVPQRVFAGLAGCATAAAFYYRFKAQKEFRNDEE